jgi:serine/threonine-protein kinase
MSPERHVGQEADRRSDIFSCGVVLYELLTGSRPFEGPPESVGEKICGETYRPASELNPKGSPAALDAVLARALAKNPEERFPTARDFAGALESAFRDSGEPARPSDGGDASRTLRREDSSVLLSASLRLSVEDLRALESLFTRHVGPMAKVLLKRAARTAIDGSMLAGQLAQAIPDESARKAFMAEAMEKLAAASGGGGSSPSVRFSRNLIEGALLDTAALRLARYIGPIARVIAKKTPGRPSDLGAYYRQLAENIPDAADRARFLKDAGYAK